MPDPITPNKQTASDIANAFRNMIEAERQVAWLRKMTPHGIDPMNAEESGHSEELLSAIRKHMAPISRKSDPGLNGSFQGRILQAVGPIEEKRSQSVPVYRLGDDVPGGSNKDRLIIRLTKNHLDQMTAFEAEKSMMANKTGGLSEARKNLPDTLKILLDPAMTPFITNLDNSSLHLDPKKMIATHAGHPPSMTEDMYSMVRGALGESRRIGLQQMMYDEKEHSNHQATSDRRTIPSGLFSSAKGRSDGLSR